MHRWTSFTDAVYAALCLPRRSVNEFWQHTVSTAENSNDDFKHQSLPLARIKKVMKSDPEVQVRCRRSPPVSGPADPVHA